MNPFDALPFRDRLREYARMWGRGDPRFAGQRRRHPRNPLATLRDWWHRPVTDRLDRIEQNTRRTTVNVGMPDRPAVRDLNEAMSGRGSWQPYPPQRRPL